MNKVPVFLVGSIACSNNSFKALSKIFAAYFDKSKAQQRAIAEQELGDIMVDNQRYTQRTAVFEVEVGYARALKYVHVVWSFAVALDGSGQVANSIDGVYYNEKLAKKKFDEIQEGELRIKGILFRRTKAQIKLEVE